MGRITGVTFEIGARLSNSLGATFQTVQTRMGRLGQKARELGEIQKRIDKMAVTQGNVERAKLAYAASPTADLAKELNRAQRAFGNAQRVAQKYNLSIENMAQAEAKARNELAKTQAAMKRLAVYQSNAEKRRDLHGRVMGTIAQVGSVIAPVKMAIDYETSLSEVKKVTDLTASEFQGYASDMLNMSTKIPMAVTELNDIAAAAARAGIAKTREELKDAAHDAAIMGVAFDISGGQAGDAMTQLRNIFHLSREEMLGLGDSMNALANSMFVTGEDLIKFSIGAGNATNFNMTGEQVAAFGATMKDLGIGVEEGSTAFNAMLTRLNNADVLGKKVAAVYDNIGISAKDMSRMVKEDAVGAVLTFLEACKNSEDPAKNLSISMGVEHSPKIAKLMNSTDTLRNALELASDKAKNAGSMFNEYEVKSKTTANSLLLLKNSVNQFGITVGQTVLPVVSTLADKMAAVTQKFTAFAESHPALSRGLIMVGGGLAGLSVTALASAYAATFVSDGFTLLGGGLSRIVPVIKGLVTGQWALNAAMMANPIGLTIAAVAAVGAGLVLLYNKCETFRNAMNTLGGTIKGVALAAWNTVKPLGERLANALKPIGGALVAVGRVVGPLLLFPVVASLTAMVKGATWAVKGIAAAFGYAGKFIGWVWNSVAAITAPVFEGIAAAASWCVETFRPVWEPVADFFKGVWEGIKAPAVALFDFVAEKFAWLADKVKWLGDTWGTVKGWFSDDDGKPVAASGGSGVTAPTAGLTPPGQGLAALTSPAPIQNITAAVALGAPAPPSVGFNLPAFAAPKFEAAGSPALGEAPALGEVPALELGDLTSPPAAGQSSMDVAALLAPKTAKGGKGTAAGGPASSAAGPGGEPAIYVTLNIENNLNGIPAGEFGDRTIDTLKKRMNELQDALSKAIAQAVARDRRAAFAG